MQHPLQIYAAVADLELAHLMSMFDHASDCI